MTDRRPREFFPALLGGVASSALFAVAASQTWVTGTASAATFTSQQVRDVAGSDAAPFVGGLALVGLAAWGVVLFARTAGRRIALTVGVAAQSVAVVGALAAATGSRVEVEVSRQLGDPEGYRLDWSPWFAIGLAAGVLAVLVGLVALVRCGRWPAMGSKYDAPGAVSDVPEDPWKQLDAGIDPTL